MKKVDFLSKDQDSDMLQRAPNDLTQTRLSNRSIRSRLPVFNGDAGSLDDERVSFKSRIQ